MKKNVDEFLFARWVTICYGSEELIQMSGNRWKQLFKHYLQVVKPNYMKNGTFKSCKEYLKTNPISQIEYRDKIVEKIKYVPYESNGCDCGQVVCSTCN